MTEDSRQRIVSRRVLTPKGGEEGGGGGDRRMRSGRTSGRSRSGSDRSRPIASGRATQRVTLPESLTTYRIMAVAGDAASRFGSASSEIRVSKPITLLAAFPRFLALGDRASFGARRHQHPARRRRRGGHDSQPRSSGAGVRERTTEHRAVEWRRKQPTGAFRRDGARRRSRARADDGASGQQHRRVRDGAAGHRAGPHRNGGGLRRDDRPRGGTADASGRHCCRAPAASTSNSPRRRSSASAKARGISPTTRTSCAEQKASAALALALAADLGAAFAMGRIAPADYRKRAADAARAICRGISAQRWRVRLLAGQLPLRALLSHGYVLHVMHVADGLGIRPTTRPLSTRALDFLETQMRRPAPAQVQWLPVWGASAAFGAKVLAEHGRNQDANITRLLADGRSAADVRAVVPGRRDGGNARPAAPRYDDVVRRLTNALRVEGDRAHVEEIDSDALAWLWNSNVRATALVLDGLVRRGDDPGLVPRPRALAAPGRARTADGGTRRRTRPRSKRSSRTTRSSSRTCRT